SPLAPVRTRHPRLSLHDALPISGFYELHVGQAFCALLVILVHRRDPASPFRQAGWRPAWWVTIALVAALSVSVLVLARDEKKERSEEHTSELQSLRHLVCRLLLE